MMLNKQLFVFILTIAVIVNKCDALTNGEDDATSVKTFQNKDLLWALIVSFVAFCLLVPIDIIINIVGVVSSNK